MNKYFTKFGNGILCKNNAEKKAREYIKTLDGILLLNEKSKDNLIQNLKDRINQINLDHKRCKDLNISIWQYDGINISIGDGICIIRIHKVISEL